LRGSRLRRQGHRALALVGALACADAAPNDPGLDALFRVEGGTFVRGERPASGLGPRVLGAFLTQTTFRVGEQHKSFSGNAEPTATAVSLALDEEPGFWIVPTALPLPEAPGAPSFDAPLSFSDAVAPGPHSLSLWAVDRAGGFGPPTRVDFVLVPQALPAGRLVVSLSWDTQSDLDLHLVTPDGVEVYAENVNSWQRPASGASEPDAWRVGGLLDADSNADCRIDGRRNENVIWTGPPPPGRYRVRVDTPSLCDEEAARWRVDVLLDGQSIGAAAGSSFRSATRFAHGRGAGVLALEFDVP
jgi:hypothetical protein